MAHIKKLSEKQQRILDLLATPKRRRDLAIWSDMSETAIEPILKSLHNASARLIHISGWYKNANGSYVPIYQAGEGIDKEKPKGGVPALVVYVPDVEALFYGGKTRDRDAAKYHLS